jgi:type I restriction enzyme R subunit
VAGDIVQHFLGRGFRGKAMVVSIDKATALRMHDKVRKHWQAERARLQAERGRYNISDAEKSAASERLAFLESTDLAVIVSPGQNEIEQMKLRGLDIVPHRKRMNDEALDEKFKDTTDPLRLVFVCAMWLTGFDAPSCSTVYLDKPMRNHSLMQTIARANRVFPGKHSGVIVDYANVFTSLEKALAIYGKGTGGGGPVKDKKKLVEELRKAVAAVTVFCAQHQVILPAIEQLPLGDMRRLERIADAVNALISPDGVRKDFRAQEKLVATLYNAVKPDPAVVEFSPRAACLAAIADAIRATLDPGSVDVSKVIWKVGELLDTSITGVEMPAKPVPVIDLSKIDFEALRSRFKESRRQNLEVEKLKAAIRAQLDKLIRFNKTRVDFQDKFEELIESYNSGSRNIEELFEELVRLSRSLSEEEQRHVRESLTEAELTVFDILTRPGPDLSATERDEVKKVARTLLDRLNAVLVLDWRKRNDSRARVREAIEATLDALPESYTRELFQQKVRAVFEHTYESSVA